MRYSPLGYFGVPAVAVGTLILGAYLIAHFMPPGPSWMNAGLYSVLLVACGFLSFLAYRYTDEVMLQILARLDGEVSISTVRQIVAEWRTGEKRNRAKEAA